MVKIFCFFAKFGVDKRRDSCYSKQVDSDKDNSTWGYSSAGRALEWHSRGQRFDPAYLHQRKTLKPQRFRGFFFFVKYVNQHKVSTKSVNKFEHFFLPSYFNSKKPVCHSTSPAIFLSMFAIIWAVVTKAEASFVSALIAALSSALPDNQSRNRSRLTAISAHFPALKVASIASFRASLRAFPKQASKQNRLQGFHTRDSADGCDG